MAGRTSKYGPETTKTIADLLRNGNTRQASYIFAGIGAETFHRWLNNKREFREAIELAEAEAETHAVAVIKRAAIGEKTRKTVTKTYKRGDVTVTETTVTESVEYDWRAAAFFLERKNPKAWRERKSVDVSDLTDEKLIALLEEEASSGG